MKIYITNIKLYKAVIRLTELNFILVGIFAFFNNISALQSYKNIADEKISYNEFFLSQYNLYI